MGIEDRDYMAGTRSTVQWGGQRYGGGRSMVTTLIIINVVIFLLQTLTWQSHILERWAALDINDVLRGQIWRLTTYDFLHDTSSNFPWHLLFNMWLLYLAGKRVEARYGSNEFLAFYLLAGVISGLGFVLWGLLTGDGSVAIGASGAAVAVMFVYAINWPSERWYIWGILPVPVIVLAMIGAAWDIFPMLQTLSGRAPGDGIAHAAHVGGMVFGVLYARFQWRITDWFGGKGGGHWKRTFSRRPKLRVHVPDDEEIVSPRPVIPEDVESRLDRLLEKIAAQGESSLTPDERRFLTETSRRYRERR